MLDLIVDAKIAVEISLGISLEISLGILFDKHTNHCNKTRKFILRMIVF